MGELPASSPVWLGLVALMGCVVGSFLNVVIYRVPRGLSVVRPRSRCPHCERAIRPWENVPIVSFLVLGGRCAGCRRAIPARYPIVEIVTALLFVAVARWFDAGLALPFLLFFVAAQVAIAWIDFDFRIIPDSLSLGGLGVGLAGAFLWTVVGAEAPEGSSQGFVGALLGMLLGGGVLWLLAVGYRRLTGIDGMGGGDVKLAAMIGAFLGPAGVAFTLVLAAVLGASVGGVLMAGGRADRRTALPFGTFLAPAAVVALFVAPAFFSWYTRAFVPGS